MKLYSVVFAILVATLTFSEGYSQRTHNILFNPEARVVKAHVGPLGGFRFVQKRYLSPRFFDSLDTNLPKILDFVGGSIIPIFVPGAGGSQMGATQSNASIQQVKAITSDSYGRKLDRLQISSQQLLQTMQLTMQSSSTQQSNGNESQILTTQTQSFDWSQQSQQNIFQNHYQFVQDKDGNLHPAQPFSTKDLRGDAQLAAPLSNQQIDSQIYPQSTESHQPGENE